MPKTVFVLGSNWTRKEAIVDEDVTDGILPGMLIRQQADGTVVPHDVVGGSGPKRFAVEVSHFGQRGGAVDQILDIDKPWLAEDNIPFGVPIPGDEVLALLDEDSADVVTGDLVMSAGNGRLTKMVALLGTPQGTPEGTVSAVPDPTDAPASADALRDDLVATVIPVINENFSELLAAAQAASGNAAIGVVKTAVTIGVQTNDDNIRVIIEVM